MGKSIDQFHYTFNTLLHATNIEAIINTVESMLQIFLKITVVRIKLPHKQLEMNTHVVHITLQSPMS